MNLFNIFYFFYFIEVFIFILLFYKYIGNKLLRKKKPYYIVVTGSIAAGKSTFIEYLRDFLISKKYNVYVCEEIAVLCNRELTHFYSDIKGEREINKSFKNGSIGQLSFWFQTILLNKYKEFYKYTLNKLDQQYNVIIFDRTYLDTFFFTKINVSDELNLEYLNFKINDITLEIGINFDLVFYLDPGMDKIIKYKEKRNRDVEEDMNYEYLKKIYFAYSNNINNIYPNFIHFNSGVNLEEYNTIFQNYYNSKLFKIL
jgi:deoxyadenosine/deoxycytidine kinase